MKNAMVIIAHGSRSEDFVLTFKDIVDAIKLSNENFDIIEAASMEINKPSIEEVVEDLYNQNVNNIVIVPYFLFKGVHLKRDISDKISVLSEIYKDVEFKFAEPLGFDETIVKLLIKRAKEVL